MTKWVWILCTYFASLDVLASGRPEVDNHKNVMLRGRQVYEQHCASCHGILGEGAETWKKQNAMGELPPPPHNDQGHTWRHSDSMLIQMILKGWRDPFNKTDHLTMPAFKGRLTNDEVQAVIDYLKTLWTEEQRAYQAKETNRPRE